MRTGIPGFEWEPPTESIAPVRPPRRRGLRLFSHSRVKRDFPPTPHPPHDLRPPLLPPLNPPFLSSRSSRCTRISRICKKLRILWLLGTNGVQVVSFRRNGLYLIPLFTENIKYFAFEAWVTSFNHR